MSTYPSLNCDNKMWVESSGSDTFYPTEQFTVFHRLPKELRLLIWHHALVPRIVSLHRRDSPDGTTTQLAFLSQAPTNPVIIWVALACAESFRVVQTQYLEWPLWDFFRDISNSMFSPMHDVIYFPYEFHAPTLLQLPLKFPKQTHKLRTLALPSQSCSDLDEAMPVLEALHDLESLEELIIVKTDGVKPWGEGERVWKLPDDIEKALGVLKKEKWPEWKTPAVKVVEAEDEILTC